MTGLATRPYRFGEFDILAVSMHPSTNDWNRFMYWALGSARVLQIPNSLKFSNLFLKKLTKTGLMICRPALSG